MEQLLAHVLERRNLTGARMAAGAVRTRYQSSPKRVLAALGAWTEHPDPWARIASGLALGTITVRNQEDLATVMPWVERLANDRDDAVRRLGACGALELIWLYHFDEIWIVMEDWLERKNELVRRVVIDTMGRIVRGSKINRPSTLKRFIERGMAIIDRLNLSASPELRRTLASTVNEFGLKAPDLISPWVREWAGRSDLASLTLVKEVLDLPFGDRCRGLDKTKTLARVADVEGGMVRQVSAWLREGKGRVEHLTIIVDRLLDPLESEGPPARFRADPYRGCEFRCEFCAARALAEYGGDTAEEFVRRVVVVANAAEILARELLGGPASRERVVVVGTDSDPYQPAEEKFEITRDMLKVFLERRSPVVVHTRSELLLRDLDIFEKLAEIGLVNVLVSLPTPIEGIRKKLELGVPSVSERLRCIALLAKKGVPVGLSLSPILPRLTDHPEAIEEIVRRAADAGAAFVVPEVLHLGGTAWPKVKDFLATYIPDLVPEYEELYRGGPKARRDYRSRIEDDLVPALAAKYGADRTGLMLLPPVPAPPA